MFDSKDLAIISFLQEDGRTPFTKIAEDLDITEGSVRNRVRRLLDTGQFQIIGIVEPEALGLNEGGLIGITVEAQRLEAVAEAISQLPEVTYLVQAAGEFDLFAEVFCRNRSEFVSFLNNKLQKLPGVARTQTFLILKVYKTSYRYGGYDSAPRKTAPE
ncbi:MAG TPA: Lrp/AsnC family transcriptional regulator [Anaerolineales bacterium]|nr:Lrp/AsnC family transcriptional regulator [Anaerolineales bacterium]